MLLSQFQDAFQNGEVGSREGIDEAALSRIRPVTALESDASKVTTGFGAVQEDGGRDRAKSKRLLWFLGVLVRHGRNGERTV